MNLEVQMKFRENPKMLEYLRENSYWYKELNRNATNYKKFVEDMKVKYKIRATDKLSDAIDNIDLISTVLSTLK